MKQLLTALLLLISVSSQGQMQMHCPLHADSTLCNDVPVACIIRPTWVNGVNTWTIEVTGGHAKRFVDTFEVFGDAIKIYFTDTFKNVISYGAFIDENMGRSNFAPSGSGTYYTNTVYHAGAAQYNSYFGAYRSGYSMTTGSYNTILGNWRGTGFTTVSGYTFFTAGKNLNPNLAGFFDSASQFHLSVIPTVTTYDSVLVQEDGIIKAVLFKVSASAALDFPSTGSNDESDLTVSVTGAATGDVVSIGAPNGSVTQGTFFGWVSAADTVTIRFHNSAGGAHDPASGTFKVYVFK